MARRCASGARWIGKGGGSGSFARWFVLAGRRFSLAPSLSATGRQRNTYRVSAVLGVSLAASLSLGSEYCPVVGRPFCSAGIGRAGLCSEVVCSGIGRAGCKNLVEHEDIDFCDVSF